tara:strand:- start:520 stop:891 length:372 start_codon:yes stop_codon:yes gene_type:complete
MKIQELAKRIEGKHILKMNNDNALNSKEELLTLLKIWKTTKGATIGDITNNQINNNTQIIKLKLNSTSYYINADTTREGVLRFLENRNNGWITILNERGNMNKITNNEDRTPIEGFYMYKSIK